MHVTENLAPIGKAGNLDKHGGQKADETQGVNDKIRFGFHHIAKIKQQADKKDAVKRVDRAGSPPGEKMKTVRQNHRRAGENCHRGIGSQHREGAMLPFKKQACKGKRDHIAGNMPQVAMSECRSQQLIEMEIIRPDVAFAVDCVKTHKSGGNNQDCPGKTIITIQPVQLFILNINKFHRETFPFLHLIFFIVH